MADDDSDDLCPCGADPRPESRYCSYDCEPTHRPRRPYGRDPWAVYTAPAGPAPDAGGWQPIGYARSATSESDPPRPART